MADNNYSETYVNEQSLVDDFYAEEDRQILGNRNQLTLLRQVALQQQQQQQHELSPEVSSLTAHSHLPQDTVSQETINPTNKPN